MAELEGGADPGIHRTSWASACWQPLSQTADPLAPPTSLPIK